MVHLTVFHLLASLVGAATIIAPLSPKPPNVYILTDISNEPDDAQSLVRLLLYSNEVNILGLAATTSVWLNKTTRPDLIHNIIDAYGKVEHTLKLHSASYPTAESLHLVVRSGSHTYGSHVFKEAPSAAVLHLIETVDSLSSGEYLWVQFWGGPSILAHALHVVDSTRAEGEIQEFLDKIRIRAKFPSLFYIVSVHGWNQYGCSTWIGPFGALYPETMFIMEGDTPALLYIVPNGPGDPERPEYGNWGGRYVPVDQSLAVRTYSDTADLVIVNGREYKSRQATVWRWREAYQMDFAARMQWTLGSDGNHHPQVVVNGSLSSAPLTVILCKDETEVILDASMSSDPDGDDLDFKWTQYHESSATRWTAQAEVPSVEIMPITRGLVDAMEFHIILEVLDNGTPPLRTYKRIIVVRGNGQCSVNHDEL
ncbi:hypothetical protein V1517DRAFT_353802 [Lipomyces orientalis]|uniref:Uncharacterized protein n=1 Tax=Lipomyces orientalis TaxID=1233043 RepID=A0ACC3TJR2_9ASCO